MCACAAAGRHQIQRVVHVHRRVIGRKVERAEIVPFGLHLGSKRDSESHLAEDVFYIFDNERHRVLCTFPLAPSRHRKVGRRTDGFLPLRSIARVSRASSIAVFARLTAAPASRRSSGESDGSSFIIAVSAPLFLPTMLWRAASSVAVDVASATSDAARASISTIFSMNSWSFTVRCSERKMAKCEKAAPERRAASFPGRPLRFSAG